MLNTERHQLQKRLIQEQKRLIFVVTGFALLAVGLDLGWQNPSDVAGSWDLLLQIFMGVAFMAALFFFWLDSTGFVRNLGLIFIVVGLVGELGRYYLALYGLVWMDAVSSELPTALNYWPVLIIALFSFLPERSATVISIALMILCVLPFLLLLGTHTQLMSHSPRLVDIFHTVCIINPMVCVFSIVVARVHRDIGAFDQSFTESQTSTASGVDHAAFVVNRAGLRRSLFELLERTRSHGGELTVGLLELANGSPENIHIRVAHAFRLLNERLPVLDPVIGRWSENCLLFFVCDQSSETMTNSALDILESFNTGVLNPKIRTASMSLNAFCPGDTVTSLMERASERLEIVKTTPGEGLDTDGM